MRISAALEAVAGNMPHLSVESIMNPPHPWFDAALARQIVVFILTWRLDVPRRVVAAVSLMCREAVMRACRTVDARCEDPTFCRFVANVSDEADRLYRIKRCSSDA